MNTTDLSLDALKTKYQFTQVSATDLSVPVTIGFYEKWLKNNYHGQMQYLENHLELKKNPQLIHLDLKSAITFSQTYFPAPAPTSETFPARVALYAQNNDYHFWLKEKLQFVISDLKEKYPKEIFLAYTDSGPILERDLAQKSGLGWFGKNTCLIHPKNGSLFFIAEILTSLPAIDINPNPIEIVPDFCGTCTQCIDICPTNAIKEPHVLKADECISYLTIESKTAPPVHLRSKIHDWFFGCDLCQTVCPWNQKVFRQKKITPTKEINTASFLPLETNFDQINFFRQILTSSNKQIQKRFFGTALFRAGGFGLKRNALIVIGNKKITDLKNEVKNIKDPKLTELAHWCINQLNL
jgi:epoxyqueuosine reductase